MNTSSVPTKKMKSAKTFITKFILLRKGLRIGITEFLNDAMDATYACNRWSPTGRRPSSRTVRRENNILVFSKPNYIAGSTFPSLISS